MTLYTNIILIPINFFFPSDTFFSMDGNWIEINGDKQLNHVEHKIVERELDARGFEIISWNLLKKLNQSSVNEEALEVV